jgi:hypothetical protein
MNQDRYVDSKYNAKANAEVSVLKIQYPFKVGERKQT